MREKLLLLIVLLPVFLIGISCDAQIDVPSKQFSVLWEKELITHSEFYMSNSTFSSSFPLLNKSLIIFPEVVNYDYVLSAYDAISGNLLWKSTLVNYFGNGFTYYAIFPEQIFVSTLRKMRTSMDTGIGKLSRMVALDKSNGNVLYTLDFEPETEFVFGEIDEKRAYILLDHSIKIINTQTGDMLEEIHFQNPLDIVDIKWHFVENNLLYVKNQKNSYLRDINPYDIQVVDLSNGMIKRSNEIIKTPQDDQLARKIRLVLGATQRILHKDSSLLVFYIYNDSSIYALNRDTGLMEWERNFLDPSFRKNHEIYYTNTNQPIYIVLDQERLYALNLLDNQILWEKDISSEQVENITLFDGMLIYSDPLNENIICHDIETGGKLWENKAGLLHPLRSQIAVNSDAIYFIGEDWTFYALMKP